MNREEIYEHLRHAIEAIQEIADVEPTPISMETIPLCDVSGFDSLSAIQASIFLEDSLGVECGIETFAYIDGKLKSPLSIKEICNKLEKQLKTKE